MDQATYNYTAKSLHAPTLEAETQESTVATVTAPMDLAPVTPEHATTAEVRVW